MQATEIVTMDVRLSYPNVWEPRAIAGMGEPKYSASILIDKTDTVTQERVKSAIEAAVALGRERFGAKEFQRFRNPVRDGDERDDPNYAGSFYLNAKNKRQPKIVDRRVQPIFDQYEIYPGVVVRAQLGFYPYKHPQGGAGVGVSLNAIQKVRDGEPFAGTAPRIEDVFDVLPDKTNGAAGGAFDEVNIFG